MNFMLKVVIAAINLVCLSIGLVFPNDATAFTILPPLVTSCEWLITTTREIRGKINFGYLFLITSASIMGAACIFLGLTSYVRETSLSSEYLMVFREKVLYLAGKSFNYAYFASTVFIIFLCVSISEIVYSYRVSKFNDDTRFDSNLDIKRCKSE